SEGDSALSKPPSDVCAYAATDNVWMAIAMATDWRMGIIPSGYVPRRQEARVPCMVRYLTTTTASASRPPVSWTCMTCRPGTSGQSTAERVSPRKNLTPSILQTIAPVDAPAALRGTAWNSERNVGSIRYTAPSGGLTTRNVERSTLTSASCTLGGRG